MLFAIRFQRDAAWALLVLSAVQFPLVDTTARLILSGIDLLIAAFLLVRNRHHVVPTPQAP